MQNLKKQIGNLEEDNKKLKSLYSDELNTRKKYEAELNELKDAIGTMKAKV